MHDSFHPVDNLFAKRIFPEASEKAANVLASLLKAAREGHLCINVKENPTLAEGIALLPPSLFKTFLVFESDCLYLRRNWECEKKFLENVKRLLRQKPAIEISEKWLRGQLEQLPLNQEQKEALLKAATNTLTLISGGPGTGKTYTAAIFIRCFLQAGGKEVVITAPTGKAAANMKISLGESAGKCHISTLHSLLKRDKIYADLIIVDESSMVDAERMACLLSAIKDGARLVLLGDKEQLPPIESGRFFADLATIANTHLVELKNCLRSDLKEIINVAEQVKRGETISTEILPDIRELIPQIIQKGMQVLTPLRKGKYGFENLNLLLFKAYEQRGEKEIPIIITKNEPHLDLCNGDVGKLQLEEKMAHFSGNRVFKECQLPNYTYAYALSVHKSQGSEYEKVMLLLPKGSEIFGREMLYTAITRAKKEIIILADEGVVEQLIKNKDCRYSGVPFAPFFT
jgi:exodeoxyribonuclease V alpha subunit